MIDDLPIKESISKIRTAIAASRKLGKKPGIVLTRYHRALFLLKHWQKQIKTAQTKVKKYRRIVKRYKKKLEV